ncbi:DNA ligase (NAD(+)) LigA [Niastella vici]|uniref:DNA ligase n=1 Tax=Niastella vici TaxID=1703345 RepID=A0A1V9FZR3_9BACT|nr:NAD-dependent DNA ligase LigA [Niastella vici]OQP63822.1 DNA ligase (NAD(+)) LigA [Niastella vici]
MKNILKDTKQLLKIALTDIRLKNDGKKYVDRLCEAIAYHDHRYYVLNDPVISDAEYDRLFDLLKKIEKKWPELVFPTSPTQRIGEKLTGAFKEVAHLTPMLSLDSSYDMKAFKDFDARVKKNARRTNIMYTIEPKLDGAGISLVYEGDYLVKGATRGDGIRGEDITNNLRTLRSIPLKAAFSTYNIHKVEIRGEVVIKKESFKKLNRHRKEAGLQLFANPRNAAAGSLRLQNPEEVSGRNLTAWLYQISYAVNKEGMDVLANQICSHESAIHLLQSLGFKTPDIQKASSVKDILAICDQWNAVRDEYPYEIDGLVIKVNDFAEYKKLGFTAHHPRWAMAIKFAARQATTTLTGIDFQVGRTGAITPVAVLEPVYVGGVTITSASLHNEDFIHNKDIRLQDMVIVQRAGDVIPYIVKPVKESRSGKSQPIKFPKKCPSCHARIIRQEGESVWRCINVNCPAQVKRRIQHFASKHGMDIAGLGVKTVDRLFSANLIRCIPDIYHMDLHRIKAVAGFGDQSASNLLNVVEASKSRSLWRLINSLGIHYVGERTAHTLADAVACVTDIGNMKKKELEALPDIGDKVAASIYAFFKQRENVKMIRELKKAGVKVCNKQSRSNAKFSGLTFAFTGVLKKYTREKARDTVEQFGGRTVDNISSKVNYLVAGKNPGSKLKEARKEGRLKIIDENKFQKMIR